MKLDLMPFIKKAASMGKHREGKEPKREEKKESKIPAKKRKLLEKKEGA